MLHFYRRLGEGLVVTGADRSLGQLVVPSEAILLVVLSCQTVNISVRYKHCKIALLISAIIIPDISVSDYL